MSYGKSLSRSKIRHSATDQKMFSRTADGTHKLNVFDRPMRGGFRL